MSNEHQKTFAVGDRVGYSCAPSDPVTGPHVIEIIDFDEDGIAFYMLSGWRGWVSIGGLSYWDDGSMTKETYNFDTVGRPKQ